MFPASSGQGSQASPIAEIRVSPEGREGIASFLEKRKPGWVRELEAVQVKPPRNNRK